MQCFANQARMLMVVCLTLHATSHAESLPIGSHPPALETPHFPDRAHALVWRNWQLVPTSRIARVLDTDEATVRELSTSMGLPGKVHVPERMEDRGYITVLRRNWHLLPYEQLLTLLDMSSKQLAFSLREDDFLYHKLGLLKPKCEPVVYEGPSDAKRKRAEEIRQQVVEHFGDALHHPGEERFAFIDELSRTSQTQRQTTAENRSDRPLRFIYSYCGVFGDPLIDSEVDPFPDGLLEKLSDQGVTGVWLHVVLRQLAPGGPYFPEFGEGHEQRITNLQRLVKRAQRYGIDIYLYMNEPRSQPFAFFEERPNMAGLIVGERKLMCTSVPEVRDWIRDALTYVFRQVPNLGGVFTITASENPTNCAYRGGHRDCPRCGKRSDTEILVEVNQAIAEGVHRGSPDARVIVWDWGWRGHAKAPDIVSALPDSVWFMSVSEWALRINRGGVDQTVGEYSISAVGPGPRAKLHWRAARQAGLKTVAKVQLNCTWELSSVPYLPVLELVARHCANLAQEQVDGMMMSWSLGGYPSPNLQVSKRFHDNPQAKIPDVLDGIARDRYGKKAISHARQAWQAFSRAFEQYPYNGAVVYLAPVQVGPANLMYGRKTGYSASMVGIPYDDLDGWRGSYPSEVFAGQFETVARGWQEGLDAMQRVIDTADPPLRATAQADLGVAQAAHLYFASVGNQARFIMARDALAADELNDQQRDRLLKKVDELLLAEIDLAVKLYSIVKADSRIGFEASNHYFYVPLDLVEKVINCEHLRAQLSTGDGF